MFRPALRSAEAVAGGHRPRRRPPWPVVPPLLWATAAVAALAGLSLMLRRELWPHTPHAEFASWAVLLGALVAAGPQVARVLWDWPLAYAGPRGLRILFEIGARAAAVGLLVLEVLGCLALAALAVLFIK